MPKAGQRFPARGAKQVRELAGAFHDAHAAPAAAPARLEHPRKTDRLRHDERRVGIGGQRTRGRHRRHAGALRDLAGGHLVSKQAEGLGGGADEGDLDLRARFCEFRRFGEEAIAGMHGVGARLASDAKNSVDVEIGADRSARGADSVRLVGLEAVQRELVLLGEHRDGRLAHLVCRAEHANGDFPTVGHEHLRKLGQWRLPERLLGLRSQARRRRRQYTVEGPAAGSNHSASAGHPTGTGSCRRTAGRPSNRQNSIDMPEPFTHSLAGGSPHGSGKGPGDQKGTREGSTRIGDPDPWLPPQL